MKHKEKPAAAGVLFAGRTEEEEEQPNGEFTRSQVCSTGAAAAGCRELWSYETGLLKHGRNRKVHASVILGCL